MKINAYTEFLNKQNAHNIDVRIAIIKNLIEFLFDSGIKDIASTGKEQIGKYAQKLIGEGRNTLENFSFLSDYFDWLGFHKPYIALIEIIDCYNGLEKLADEIEKMYGCELRDFVFSEPFPPLGTDESQKYAYTRAVMDKMDERLSAEEIQRAWFKVQHGIPEENWRAGDESDQKKYRQSGGIDAFLAQKLKERNAFLTRLHDEHKLWFTTEINDEVLNYVTNDPRMEVGRREGNKVYITKVPYNPIAYFKATDTKMKRYYACHCPLVRDAILQDLPISPDICHCSLGHASHYLACLGQDLKGEILESVVKGDTRCRFVFFLPNDVE